MRYLEKRKHIKIQKMNVTGDWESFWGCKLKPRENEREKRENGILTKISTGKIFFWFRKGNLKPLIKRCYFQSEYEPPKRNQKISEV